MLVIFSPDNTTLKKVWLQFGLISLTLILVLVQLVKVEQIRGSGIQITQAVTHQRRGGRA